jgi:LPS sulfotransferase NodH
MPECQFVILTAGRTGSELLVELLDSHPQIMCDSEILGAHRALPNQLIGRRAALAKLRGAGAYGFKMVREHAAVQGVDPTQYVRDLHARGVRIILLERRDLLQQAISHVRALRKRYHFRRGDQLAFTRARLDPMAVLATIYVLEDRVAWARATLADLPHLSLVYEDHLADEAQQQRTADLVARYLEVGPAPVHSDLVKVTPAATRELIENFDEVAALLSVTRYAAYLDGLDVWTATP